ncbi:MAG: pectin acetylesterase-family hydrolase [Pseudomonadota bacterium]
MMLRKMRTLSVVALSAISLSAVAAEEWIQIPVSGEMQYELPNGEFKTIDPSCSGGPILVDGEIVAADTQYSFFVQPGSSRRLLIFLDGGGACWDAQTCVGTPLLNASTYNLTVDETPEELAASGGVFAADNPDNPYADYTKVAVPYCSGDVHWGSRDTTYTLAFPPLEWTVRHRGTDNFLSVLHWLRTQGDEVGVDFEAVRNLTVMGASAGAYGTMIAFPYVAELAPRARLRLLADAGIGVLNEPFYTTALFDPQAPEAANWGIANALPNFMGLDENFLATYVTQPLGLVPGWFAALAQYRPRAKLAMFTSNLDDTQVDFYALMEALDGRPLDDPAIPLEWYLKMQAITNATEGLRNYRTFIEDGTFHTITVSDEYYLPGASGISVRDWNQAMITFGVEGWDTVDVGSPF